MISSNDTVIANLLDGDGKAGALPDDESLERDARDAAVAATTAVQADAAALTVALAPPEDGERVSGGAIGGDTAARAIAVIDPALIGDAWHPAGGEGFAAGTGGCIAPWIGIGGWPVEDGIRIWRPWIDKVPGDEISGDDQGAYAGGDVDIDGDGLDDYVQGDYEYYGGVYATYGVYTTTSIGDVNGDGFEDWLVEGDAFSYTLYGYDAGEAGWAGDGTYDGTGYGVYTITAAGDVNGDGFEDWLVEGDGYAWTIYGYDGSNVARAGDGDAGAGEGSYDGEYAGEKPDYRVADGDLLFAPCVEPWIGRAVFDAGDGVVSVLIEPCVAIAAPVVDAVLGAAAAIPEL